MTNKQDKIIRWGIIGCGDVTELKSGPAYQKTKDFELIAVMRRDGLKAADYALRHGVPNYYTDADLLINNPDIDAVYIATPPDTHLYYGLKVAEAGKICCIEKPLSSSYEESKLIQEAFEKRNLPLFVAYYRRSLPRFLQIQKWIADTEIGSVRHVSWHLSKSPSEVDLSGVYNWRTDAKVAPGGYFDDLASHGLDLIGFLLGDIKEVSGFSINQQGLYAAKDALTACWVHENGITGTGSWNFGSSGRADRLEIIGSRGRIEFAVFDEVPIRLSNENGLIELEIAHPENIQLYHVANIREALLGNRPHPSTGLTALHCSWVMDKIIGTL